MIDIPVQQPVSFMSIECLIQFAAPLPFPNVSLLRAYMNLLGGGGRAGKGANKQGNSIRPGCVVPTLAYVYCFGWWLRANEGDAQQGLPWCSDLSPRAG